ncbi:Solute carrier organic anion transporter family member 4C1 [Aix galericulata]|nr:Solute carrier organic anion transporter family member 4C1 [Aix galericulata]
MKGDGIENPAFEPHSPDLSGQRHASRAGTGIGTDAAAEAPAPASAPAPSRGVAEAAEEGPCGWGRCTPKALQLCNNPEGYLAAYSMLAIFQGIVVNGLINISISTIEKRYELNSSLTGLISASYDIAFCILSLFVSFFGERGHKPRWLAFSAFMLGLGSLIFSLPHFSSGKYQFGAKREDTCQMSGTSSTNFTCSANTKSSLSNYLYVFILGQLLLGVGGTPLYTLGTAFIDDSVPKHKSSLYIGIGYAMSLLGPAIGYVLGGQLLNVYIDIQIPERTGMLHNLTAPCNANCKCLRSTYYPVCGRDKVQYFSPCYAGCTSSLLTNMKKAYYNCSCIGKLKIENGSEDSLYEAIPGKCPTQCTVLPLFLIFFFFAVVFTFMAVTPTTVAILRCVPDKQRSFALGVQSVFLRLLGTIPGPILFGVAIDNSCTLWDIDECKTQGACWVYDNERMAYLLLGISAACKIITIIFVIMAVLLYKPPQTSPALSQKDSEMDYTFFTITTAMFFVTEKASTAFLLKSTEKKSKTEMQTAVIDISEGKEPHPEMASEGVIKQSAQKDREQSQGLLHAENATTHKGPLP